MSLVRPKKRVAMESMPMSLSWIVSDPLDVDVMNKKTLFFRNVNRKYFQFYSEKKVLLQTANEKSF